MVRTSDSRSKKNHHNNNNIHNHHDGSNVHIHNQIVASKKAKQRDLAQIQHAIQKSLVSNAYGPIYMIGTLLCIGMIGICYVSYTYPRVIVPRISRLLGYNTLSSSLVLLLQPLPPPPPRRILTLYPRPVNIAQQLPIFYRYYSIATEENAYTRNVIRIIQQLRQNITTTTTTTTATTTTTTTNVAIRHHSNNNNDSNSTSIAAAATTNTTTAEDEASTHNRNHHHHHQPLPPQRIYLYAWEHRDFLQQLQYRPGGVDSLCGQGFFSAYQYWETKLQQAENEEYQRKQSEQQQQQQQQRYHNEADKKPSSLLSLSSSSSSFRDRQDDLVIACLLWAQKHDSVVQWNLTIERPIVPHGYTGVAVQYLNEERIYRQLLILPLLPQHNNSDSTKRLTTHQRTGHVTFVQSDVPRQMLSWMIQTYHHHWISTNHGESIDSIMLGVEYERYLYRVIRQEQEDARKESNHERWKWYIAVCDSIIRGLWDSSHVRVATDCVAAASSINMTLDGTPCCSIYDPTSSPLHQRARTVER
jgi:hypothetical protein